MAESVAGEVAAKYAEEILGGRTATPTVDDLIPERDKDGKLLPVEVMIGSGHVIKVLPLTYREARSYNSSFEQPDPSKWTPVERARLLARQLVEPGFYDHWRLNVDDGSDPATAYERFGHWIEDNLSSTEYVECLLGIVRGSHSKVRRARPVLQAALKKNPDLAMSRIGS